MRLVVEHIDEDGQQVTVSMSQEWAVEAASDALDASPTEVLGDLTVSRAHGHVFVRGHLAASAPRVCERCGEMSSIRIDSDVDLSYVPTTRQVDDFPENELKSDELDVGWYSDGIIDLSDTLREALALALPPRVVCEDESACDARTRALLDGGPVTQGHPGFAALQNWTKT